jgi:hypothetical protein
MCPAPTGQVKQTPRLPAGLKKAQKSAANKCTMKNQKGCSPHDSVFRMTLSCSDKLSQDQPFNFLGKNGAKPLLIRVSKLAKLSV